MSKVKEKKLEHLNQLDSKELVDELRSGQLSVLKSLGCNRLRREMLPIGWICRFFLWIVFIKARISYRHLNNPTRPEIGYYIPGAQYLPMHARWATIAILNFWAPSMFTGRWRPKKDDSSWDWSRITEPAQVIGFNHPTLGEIVRLVATCFDDYPNKEILFPVNLPWFEVLMKKYSLIQELGIRLMPIITPSTEKKMLKIIGDNEEAINTLAKVKRGFLMRYTLACRTEARHGGIIVAAPSATRQATIFPDQATFKGEKRPYRVLGWIANEIFKDESTECEFTPIYVEPPKRHNRLLNLCKRYSLNFGKTYTTEEMRAIGQRDPHYRNFDYEFLNKIAELAPPEAIAPPY